MSFSDLAAPSPACAQKMSKLIFVGRKTFQFSLHVRLVSQLVGAWHATLAKDR